MVWSMFGVNFWVVVKFGDSGGLTGTAVYRSLNAMKKKKSTKQKVTRKPKPDFSQNALAVVEKAIGGKLMGMVKK